MNKNRYRIIFSHARGMFIAVAEIVKSKTKQAGQSQGTMETDSVTSSVSPIHYKKLNPLNFAVIGCLGALVISLPMSSVAGTQIVADKGAPTSQQPTILNSANGTTQVNIQTPSAGGVSRNTYTQFDVGQEGAILNNSRNNTQTQLGGWVQGNPWLANGEAKVILNEVNSSNPSQLKGYIEVAGKQAQVVIANPSGLVCDGCGVINADRFTLTTGQAVMNQGYLESFRVREGQVTIEGKGLNGSLTPYTDIYARALKVNAGLYANELGTVLGQNDIQVKDQVTPQIKAVTGSTSTPQPNFALDVGQLGGMYAGKIFLVGTEQGLGVRNAGSINSTQSTLTLNVNGDLVNNGNLITNKDQIELKAQNIQNTGNISSATSQVSITSQNLNNSGLISSADELHLENQNSITNSGTLNAARIAINSKNLKNSGSIEQTGLQGLDLKSGSMTNLGGKIGIAKTSGGNTGGSTAGSVPTTPTDPSKDGGSLGVVTPVDTTPKTYDTGFIHVSDVLNNDQGAIVANGGVDLDSQNGLDNQGGQLNVGAINIKGNSFNNNQGQLTVKSANIQTSSFTNQQGQLASNSTLNIQSQSANNKGGKIQSIGQLDLATTGELNNVDGQIASGANVNVTANDLKNQSGVVYSENQAVNIKANKAIDNTEGLIQAKTNLNLDSQSLNNTSGQIVADQINQKHVTVNNNQGSISAQQNLNSTAQQFDNTQGQIQAKSIKLQHDQLKNTGSVYADQDLTITGQNTQNAGTLAAGKNVQITSSALDHAQDGLIAAGLNREGKLGDTGDLTISVDRAGLHGQTFAGRNIQVDATGKIDAAQGHLQSKMIALNAGTDISTQAATVVAQDQLKLTSQNLINNQQGLLSSQDLILTAKQLDNSQGKIQHTGSNDLSLQFANGLNNKAGEISSNASSINLNTSALNNEAGKIIHAGNQQLNITADQLQGTQGQILTNGQLFVDAGQVVLDGATTSADQINLSANSLSHQKGQMVQRGTLNPLTLAIKDQMNNQLGLIQSQSGLQLKTTTLNNQGGQLSSALNYDVQLEVAGLLDNSQSGKIYAGQNGSIQAGSINNNLSGLISAQNALTLTSLGVINNQSGKIIANSDVGIQSEGLDNTGGQIGSVQGGLTLDAGAGKLTNQSGSLQSAQDIQIKANQLSNQSGLINTQGAIQAQITQDIDNSAGQIVANKAVSLSSQGLNNKAGLIGSVEDIVNINTGSSVLSNQQGHIQSVKGLTLKAQGIDNQQGVIATQAKLDMQQQWLNNTKGQIISGTTLSFVGEDFNNQGGLLQSGADLNFKLSGLLDNSQSGQLASGGNTVIQAGSVKNSGPGKISAQGVLNIDAVQAIDNQSGTMVANQDITLKSQGLNNSQGQIGSKNSSLTINAGQGQLSNQAGSLQAGTELRLEAAVINNDSGTVGSLGNSHILSSGDISNNAGQIATNATLQVSGQNLTNQAGTIQSGNGSALDLVINGALDNSQAGQLLSGAGLNLQVNSLDNSQQGQISAQDALNIMSAGLITNQAGTIVANQDVTLNSQGLNNNAGQIGSIQGGLTVDTRNQALSNQAGTLQAKTDLTAKALSIDSRIGQIISQAKIDLQSQKEINNQQGIISADQGVQVESTGLNNNVGQIGSAQGDIVLNVGQGLLSNQTGKIVAGQALQLTADQVDNSQQGHLNSQTTLDIRTTKDINNQSGVIAANQKVNLNSQGLNNNKGQIVGLNDALTVNSGAGTFDNQSGVLQAKGNIQIDAEQVNSQSGLISSEDRIDLQAHQLVDNNSGQIIANNAVQIQSLGLKNNQGQIASVNDVLNIHSGSGELQNQAGLLQAQGDIQLTADRLLNQSGLINTQGNLVAQIAQDIDNKAGQIVANQAVQLNSQGLNNNAGQIGSVAGDVFLDAGSGDLSNQSGKIISTQDLTLNAQHVDNQSGLISAQQLVFNTQGLNNLKGQIISGTALTFVGQDLNNQGGLLQTNSDLNINLSGVLDNSLGGQLYSGGSTTVQAASLNNSSQGQISTQGDLNLTTAQEINNAGGIIVASQQMQLKSQGLNNDGGQIGTEQGDLLVQTGDLALNNGTGAIQSGKTLSLDVNGLNNSGVISALEQLTVSSLGDVNNDHGQIVSNKQVHLTGQNLSNQTGIIQSGEQADLELNINGALNNQTGQIHSGASTQINASSINNSQQGQISAQDALNIISAGLVDNQAGTLVATQDVTLNSQGLNNNQGQIGSVEGGLDIDTGNQALSNQAGTLQAKTDIAVKSLSVDNSAGQINAQGGIDLVSQQNINNTQGSIVGDQRLNLKVQGLNNNQGQIGTQGDLNLSVSSGPLQNQTGLLQAGQNIIVDAAAIDNSSSGKINAQGSVALQSTGLINNTTGVIAANQDVTLTAQGLNNTQGQIGSVAGSLNLDSGDQILNNQSGSLLSNNQISIHTTGLNNSQGQIVAQQLLDIDAELQALNNQNGLMSSDTVNVTSGAFNNDQGLVQAKTSLVLDTNGQNLVNTNSGAQGGLLSQGNLTLKHLGLLDNTKGYVASGQNLDISAHQVENGGGTLLAAKNLKLQGTGQNQLLNNQLGQILSMGDMQLSIEHINNQGKLTSTDTDSHIMAAGQLDIQTQQLDNQNTKALIDTDTSVQGIDAGNLNLDASIVNNQSGTIRSSENSQLNISQQLNNQAGEISAVKQLGIQGDQLVVNNLNGQLLAGENLNINVKSLSGDGQVLSLGDANITLKDGFKQTQTGQLQANNNLSLSTAGDIQNDGTMNAGNQLQLTASNITNSSNAKIESHDTQLTAQNQINNTGLINGDYTTLTADTLNNQGTGRIYGTDLAISASTLNNLPDVNGVAPVIASRGDMNLGVQTLNNLANTTDYTSQALIFSAGNLYLGGALDTKRKATGQATVINNESATIESLGDMYLSAARINNINKHFITDDNVEVSRVDGLEKFCNAWCTFDGQYDGGNWSEDWMRYTYSEITYETRTVESAPGQIKAGGNLDLSGAQVLNDKSQILAGGELKNLGGTIDSGNNLDGIRKVVDQGTQTKYWKYEGQWDNPFEVSTESTFDLQISQALGNQNFSQNPISITAVANNQSGDLVQAGQTQAGHLNDLKDSDASTQVGDVQNAQGQQLNVADTGASSHQVSVQGGQQNLSTQEMKELNVDVDGSGLDVSQAGQAGGENLTSIQPDTIQSDVQVSDVNQNTNIVAGKDNTTQISVLDQLQGQTASQVSGATTTDQAIAPDQAGTGEQLEIRTINNNNIKVANNALYRTGADSKAGYLVETDPSFTNYNQWLSSDYMLSALGLDPALQQKRLGDGFYEQRMVQDQIANLTGYRFLEGYASDEEQYKALMNNGVTFAKQYGLQPGIALTAAQIAQLTSDIVWLVEKDVTLPDGTVTKALVPQVYVKARVGDLKGDGSLLSGNSINFKLNGDLLNGSTIAGREAVQITADNVNNLMGRIQGNTVDITTKKDLNNIGGQISAKDAMAVKVGGNLKIETTTRTSTSQVGDFSASTTGVDRVAGLYVGSGNKIQPNKATLVVDVAGNTVLKAAQLNNSNGATVINTVGNVDIGTVKTGYKLTTYRDAQNHATSQKTQDVGSQLNSNSSLLLNGQNIKVQGSGLNSEQGTTQLSAVNQLDIEEGRKTIQFDRQWYEKHKGTLGSKTDTGFTHDQASEAISSTISGKKVLLDANNINIRGSQVVSNELTQIQAKENVNIVAAENQYANQQEQTVKKSGFKASLSDGVASVGYGKSSLNTKEDGKSTTLAQSVVRSQKGDTTIIAGKDLTTEAAILDAGKDLNLKGANVNLNSAYATDEQHSEVHSKQSGISVGVTYSPAMAAASAYKNSMNNGQFSDSAVGQVMAQGEAVRKASMAAMTPVTIQAGNNKTNEVSNTSSTQAVVTQATAKGNLNIIATEGNINSQGAQLSAEGDALLHAKENINLGVAENHSEQTADRKQSGFSIDNRDWAAPAGTFKNKNQGDGRSTQTTGTQLSVGGKTTLQTGQGDINIIGSSVASKGDVNLNAARDINIKSSQNSQSQSEQSSNKGIGSAQISDTEQFYGYMNGQSQSKSHGIEQQRSQVGSLEGNVNIQAGRQYTQQVADVIAAKDLNVKAQDIQVLEGHDTGSSSENSKDLKIGQFSRVSSPLIDLVNAADKATKSQADDRTQALQAVAAGAQGYQTYSDIKGGALFKAESGIGFSTSKNQQNSSYATSQQNNLKAGGNVNLTSTNGDIHLQNTQVKAEDKINLDSSKNIILESGQSQNKADGKNSNAGLSVGVGVSVGAQTGAYIYGEAGFGKGSNHLDSNTHNQTTLDAKNISLTSKGDTTLRGAQANANRIDADVGGQLKVESLQDTVEQNTKQTGAGGRLQASFGTAWQASGNFSSNKASGDSNSVNQQSGLFAGDGGYHVKADSVDLKGGAIVSTATKDKNDLTTNQLTFSNIENKSQYDATTVSLSGGTKFGKETSTDSSGVKYTNNVNWRDSTSFSPSLPQHESDKDSSTTYATLSEGNIKVGGQSTTVEQLGIHSDASTANRAVETLPNLQTILDKQKTVADATSTIAAASRTYAQDQIKNAAAEKEAIGKQIASQLSPEEQTKLKGMSAADKDAYLAQYGIYDAALANEKAVTQQWGMGGDKSRALNAVTTVITGALGGQTDLQVVANTLAPYAAQQIGEKFGHGEDKNKAAQLASHAILGATLAYLNGGNPAAGGGAAIASEAAADYLANQYNDGNTAINPETGKFDANLLPENIKSSIRDLTAAIGAFVGGTVGDSASNAQLAGVIGQNAVENNEMGFPTIVNPDWASGAESLTKFAKDKNLSQKETQKLLSEYTKGKVPTGYDPVRYYIYLSMGMPAVAFAPESIGIASLGGGVIGAGSDVIVQSANNNPYDWRNTAIAFGVGAITQGKGVGFNIGANVYSEGAKAYLNNESMESAGVKATATTIVSTAMEKVINKKIPTSNSVVKEVLTPAFSSTAVGIASDKLDEKMKEKK